MDDEPIDPFADQFPDLYSYGIMDRKNLVSSLERIFQ